MDRRTRFFSLVAAAFASAVVSAAAQGLAPDCAAIKEANPAAGDGTYVIAPGGRMFHAWCHDMGGTPKEYLTLEVTGGASNYSTWGGEWSPPVNTVTTHYTKIRIDPATLLVNVADQTFSSSAGSDCCVGPTVIVSMPYAHASSCRGDWWAAGSGNVDLSGTPFTVDDVFTVRGWNPAGGANGGFSYGDLSTFVVQSQVFDLQGGGFCGGIGPTIDGGVFNQFAGFDLQLAYTGNPGIGKDSCKTGGWEAFGVFRNQGDCVSFFATQGKNPPAR